MSTPFFRLQQNELFGYSKEKFTMTIEFHKRIKTNHKWLSWVKDQQQMVQQAIKMAGLFIFVNRYKALAIHSDNRINSLYVRKIDQLYLNPQSKHMWQVNKWIKINTSEAVFPCKSDFFLKHSVLNVCPLQPMMKVMKMEL